MACLLYDCEPRREVTLLRSSPLETVTHLSSNGEEVTIETRIHVLTSQHEDSLFRICVKYQDVEIVSDAVKVISKADTVKKAKDKTQSTSSTNTSTANKKKRSASEAFGDTLYRIEQQQKEQQKVIDMLYQQNVLLMNQLNSQTPPASPTEPSSPKNTMNPSPSSSTETSCSPPWKDSTRCRISRKQAMVSSRAC